MSVLSEQIVCYPACVNPMDIIILGFFEIIDLPMQCGLWRIVLQFIYITTISL